METFKCVFRGEPQQETQTWKETAWGSEAAQSNHDTKEVQKPGRSLITGKAFCSQNLLWMSNKETVLPIRSTLALGTYGSRALFYPKAIGTASSSMFSDPMKPTDHVYSKAWAAYQKYV